MKIFLNVKTQEQLHSWKEMTRLFNIWFFVLVICFQLFQLRNIIAAKKSIWLAWESNWRPPTLLDCALPLSHLVLFEFLQHFGFFCKFAILCSIILCTRKHCCQFLNVGSIVANCYMAHAFKRALLSLANSPGLVVIGGDLCSEGHEFESQHCIMDGHFSHLFVCFKRWK